jgi:predicted O-methyltransferase YrrM
MAGGHVKQVTFEFSNQWFDGHIDNWVRVFNAHVPARPRILEVGSFEGRSAVWLLQRMYEKHGGGELYCVDPFIATVTEAQHGNMQQVRKRFLSNIEKARMLWPPTVFHHLEKPSVLALSELIPTMAGSFDVIYVDGDHTAAAALTDLVLSLQLIKKGGIIIADDYLWDKAKDILDAPKFGIDCFANTFAREMKVLPHLPNYQIFFKRQ